MTSKFIRLSQTFRGTARQADTELCARCSTARHRTRPAPGRPRASTSTMAGRMRAARAVPGDVADLPGPDRADHPAHARARAPGVAYRQAPRRPWPLHEGGQPVPKAIRNHHAILSAALQLSDQGLVWYASFGLKSMSQEAAEVGNAVATLIQLLPHSGGRGERWSSSARQLGHAMDWAKYALIVEEYVG